MPSFQTLNDLRFNGKVVLLRADLNVPMKNGRVSDATRLERLLPTLKELARNEARIVLFSHFGRPNGKPDPKYSLRPVAAELSVLWGQTIAFAEDCVGNVAAKAVAALKPGEILMLENTRFYPGEEANDPAFAKDLAALGEIFVNDAFSAAHRAHASTTGLANLLPAVAGRLMQEELEALGRALEAPERPLAALVGGSKISTKLDLLQNLIAKVDLLVLGGGMANTFLAAQGIAIGNSLFEADMLETARTIMAEATQRGCHILLPKDVVIAKELKPGVESQIVATTAVPADQMIFDLGPQTVAEIKDNLVQCKTVIWNGPLGVFEVPPFDKATNEVAIGVADLTKRGKIMSVAGGGDTVAALAHAGVTQGIGYLSTAGGAFLEWLEGKELPGVAALTEALPPVKKGKVLI
ncbi:MAG: phosphoglycerate kinase [Alphaproteobacteria bacterium]|nr:phosphoglycerate kinase [Alphaproteobacteria bacterium]